MRCVYFIFFPCLFIPEAFSALRNAGMYLGGDTKIKLERQCFAILLRLAIDWTRATLQIVHVPQLSIDLFLSRRPPRFLLIDDKYISTYSVHM